MIPTAEALLEKYEKEFKDNGIVFDLKKPMIEFAKLHVEAALEAAADNSVKLSSTWSTVRNSYDLNDIK